MIYLKDFKIFENSSRSSRSSKTLSKEEIMGRLLHVYGSIPLFKQKAYIVIKKMLWKNPFRPKYPFFNLGEDVDLNGSAPHDKVRFIDYFDSLLSSKETRGHNFEGTIAGLFNGTLSKPGEKWDVVIENKTWSVKFVDESWKAPEIGKYKDSIKVNNLTREIEQYKGITNLFKVHDDDYAEELKNEVWFNVILPGITGGWLIAYPYKGNIIVNIIDIPTMKEILFSGYTVSPKAGLADFFSLALGAKYKQLTKKFTIHIPKMDIKELKDIYLNKIEDKWSQNIFGKYSNKIRPDVLRYIKANQEEIANKLLNFKDF